LTDNEQGVLGSQDWTENLGLQSDSFLEEKLNLILKEIERRKQEHTLTLDSSDKKTFISGSTTPNESAINFPNDADVSLTGNVVNQCGSRNVVRQVRTSTPKVSSKSENAASAPDNRFAKRRIAHQRPSSFASEGKNTIKEALARATSSQGTRSSLPGSDLVYDSFFGIKIQCFRHPKISSTVLDCLVADRPKKRIGALLKMRDVSSSEWVTMGVIVSKSERKTSARGNPYVIWRLTDLRNSHDVISAFLFGNCLDKHWLLPAGTVVALLNAACMKDKNAFISNKVNTLKLDVAENVLELGLCPDYGICKSRQAKTGEQCSNFVNKSESDVCDFHLSSTLKRYASKRGELQYASSLPPGRRIVSSAPLQPRPASQGVSKGIKISSSKVTISDVKGMFKKTGKANGKGNGGGQDEPTLLSALHRPTVGSKSLLKALGVEEPESFKIGALSSRRHLGNYTMMSHRGVAKKQEPKTSLPAIPKLGKDSKDGVILLDDAASEERRSKEIKRRACGGLAGRQHERPESQCKKGRLGELVISKEEMANLAGRSTEAEKELSVEETAKQEQYFNLMEAREKLETHASQLFEIPNCTVITCKKRTTVFNSYLFNKCDYTWHSRSEFCKQQGHVVSKTTATKRFFQCKACGKRAVAYAMYPKKPCTQCKATEFQRVAMKEERKGPKLGAEALKVRGEELPFATS
ncbi:primase zinc finger, partial [Trichuris suis]